MLKGTNSDNIVKYEGSGIVCHVDRNYSMLDVIPAALTVGL